MDSERVAIIRGLDGDSVTVEIAADSACGGCSSRSACGSQGTRLLRLPLAACDGVAAGQRPVPGSRVRVTSELPIIGAGLLAYLLPVLSLLVVATASQLLIEGLAGGAAPPLLADLGAAGGALLGLLGGLLALRRLGRRFRLRLAPLDPDS